MTIEKIKQIKTNMIQSWIYTESISEKKKIEYAYMDLFDETYIEFLADVAIYSI